MKIRSGSLSKVILMLLAEACNLWSVKLEKSRDVSFLPLSSIKFFCMLDDKSATGS